MKIYKKSMQDILPGLRARIITLRLIAKVYLILVFLAASMAHAAVGETVWPGRAWVTRAPTEVDMDPDKLAVLADYVGERGCVVRHGCMIYSWGSQSKRDYVFSAEKPW